MIKEAIASLIAGKDLSQKEAYDTMQQIMSGQATPSQIAGFLVALVNKGESVDEIAGCALSMRENALPLTVKSKNLVDNCGTGGDGQCSLNVSTAASFVVAGAGYPVAKHGNRAVSSKCGSADVLEALGVKVDPPSMVVEKCIDEAGIGFLFAPNFHPAMKYAMPTRKELGIRTIFNILGPLSNPARAKVQLIGVYKPELTKVLAKALVAMGHIGALVVHSDGWDEITLSGRTKVSELLRGKVRSYFLTAEHFGLPEVKVSELTGGTPDQNAARLKEILQGKNTPARSVVVANAAALIWIAERAYNEKSMQLREAVDVAEQSIDSGAAWKKCEALAELSQMIN